MILEDKTKQEEAIKEIESLRNIALQLSERLGEFYRIGTVEEFKELKKKSIPKNPIDKIRLIYPDIGGKCPTCGLHINNHFSWMYCECGQRIDWSEGD